MHCSVKPRAVFCLALMVVLSRVPSSFLGFEVILQGMSDFHGGFGWASLLAFTAVFKRLTFYQGFMHFLENLGGKAKHPTKKNTCAQNPPCFFSGALLPSRALGAPFLVLFLLSARGRPSGNSISRHCSKVRGSQRTSEKAPTAPLQALKRLKSRSVGICSGEKRPKT